MAVSGVANARMMSIFRPGMRAGEEVTQAGNHGQAGGRRGRTCAGRHDAAGCIAG